MIKNFEFANIRRWTNHNGVEIYKKYDEMCEYINVTIVFNAPAPGFVTVTYMDKTAKKDETLITNSITIYGE